MDSLVYAPYFLSPYLPTGTGTGTGTGAGTGAGTGTGDLSRDYGGFTTGTVLVNDSSLALPHNPHVSCQRTSPYEL